MIIFLLFFFLGLAFAVGGMLLYRYFTKYTIHEVCFPLRMPFWQSLLGWIGMVAGLVVMGVQLGMGTPKRWNETFGWKLFLASLAGWLGAWFGGIVTTYILQYFTFWPVDPIPQPPPDEQKKP